MTTILITGASRGIGRELVQRAVARGDTVFACVRKQTDVQKWPASPNLNVLIMDVADSTSVTAAFAELDKRLNGAALNAVINAAAIAPTGAVELTTVDEFHNTLNTNTLGSLRILQAAIPRLRGHGGRLILVTSLWGRASGAMVGAYCASKHAVEAIADSARRETMGMNVHISLVEPGVVKTEMFSNQAAETQGLIARMSPADRTLYGVMYQRFIKLLGGAAGTAISASQAAAGIEKPLFAGRPKPRYRVGTDSKIVCSLNWLLPDRWMDGVMAASLNHKPLPPGKL